MDWSVSIASFPRRPLEPLLDAIAASGFGSIEFLCMRTNPPGNCWRDTERVLRALRASGLRAATVHTSGAGWHNADPDEAVRRASVEAAAEGFGFAADIGAHVVVCHAIHPSAAVTEANHSEYRHRVAESLTILAERAVANGVNMAVENMPSHGKPLPGSRVADLLELTADLGDHVGVCLDTGHCSTSGLEPAVEAAVGRERILNVHVHDSVPSGGDHLLPGEGTIDWPCFVQSLAAAAPTSMLTFEVNVPEGSDGKYLCEFARLRDEWRSMV